MQFARYLKVLALGASVSGPASALSLEDAIIFVLESNPNIQAAESDKQAVEFLGAVQGEAGDRIAQQNEVSESVGQPATAGKQHVDHDERHGRHGVNRVQCRASETKTGIQTDDDDPLTLLGETIEKKGPLVKERIRHTKKTKKDKKIVGCYLH